MKRLNKTIDKHILYAMMSLMTLTFLSCEDDNVGGFVLTGNIKHLIPKGTYRLEKTKSDDGQYLIFTPVLHSNFEYWGLTLKQVEYYIDDALYSTATASPYEIRINKDDMSIGNHELKARMTIVGEACDDVVLEEEDVFYISSKNEISDRHGEFYVNYNYVTTGDELVVTPELLIDRSTEECEIDQVEYYWNGTLISTATSSPFELRRKVTEEAGTSHALDLTITYHDKYSDKLVMYWSFNNFTIRTADDYSITWGLKSLRDDYKNGETISLISKAYKGINVTKDFEIKFYFDDELIGQSSSFPYALDYTLENLEKGSHTITGETVTKEGNSSVTVSHEETIIITE